MEKLEQENLLEKFLVTVKSYVEPSMPGAKIQKIAGERDLSA